MTTASEYVGKWNKYGQCLVIRSEYAHLPHVSYTYHDGGGMVAGHGPVFPGKSVEESIPSSRYDQFHAVPVELFDDRPSDASIYAAWHPVA